MALQRRVFLISAAAGSGLASLSAQAQPMVDEKDPSAVGLGYVADARRVDTKKYPRYAAGQLCSNCSLYRGAANSKAGGCTVFPAKQVAAAGWCNVYAKKA
jgi:hypothetical protein